MPGPSHITRQLKFIAPGAAITYYLSVLEKFSQVWTHGNTTAWTLAVLSTALSVATVSLFLYILLTPLLKGVQQPDYTSWRESGVLSFVIPILTSTIILGWISLVVTLASYTSLGVIKGVIGSLGVYALFFGLMGLIPAPRVRRK